MVAWLLKLSNSSSVSTPLSIAWFKQLTLILFCFYSCSLYAQPRIPFEYKQFTMVDGLPDNTVYNSLHDSQNYMWFFTSSGVSRFDGRQFENYNYSKNMADNEILGGFEDKSGRIWFKTMNGKLCYFDIKSQKIESYKNNPLLKQASKSNLITTILEDKYRNVWIAYNNANYTLIRLDNSLLNGSLGNVSTIGFSLDDSRDVFSFGTKIQKYDTLNQSFKVIGESNIRRRVLANYKGRTFYAK